MDKANNNSDIGRTWSSVLEDLGALERLDDYGASYAGGIVHHPNCTCHDY